MQRFQTADGAVDAAGARCKEAGAKRAMPLPVSAPFHCALMKPVQPRLAEVLETIKVSDPSVPVVSNVRSTGQAGPSYLPGTPCGS